MLSPNEMWAALIGISGHVAVPLKAADYIELLPSRRCAIGAEGIRFDYRTYDSTSLNGHRHRSTAPDGKWEVHYNPYEPSRCWVRLPDGWAEAGWIHRNLVSQPFSDTAWRHIRTVVEQRTGRAEHEELLARALDALLRRAAAATAGVREQPPSVPRAGGGRAASETGQLPAVSGPTDPALAPPYADLTGEDEQEQDQTDERDEGTDIRPWHVFDAHQEAQRW
ncbi:hypothetical protein [Streptomyces sp. YIM S03343]